jgi:hypothetical protein
MNAPTETIQRVAGTTHINTINGYHEHMGGAGYVFVTPEMADAERSASRADHYPRKMYRRSIKVGGVTFPLFFVVELH